MALNKVIYVDGETVITAENLNEIQDAIIELEQGGTITVDSALSNTSENPVQNKVITQALGAKAPLASPIFTGTPKAPTAASGTNTTQLATTAFVQQEIGGIRVPTKTSDLTNDSGFVNGSGAAAAAPVQSVNGQTGAVTVPSLPTGGTAGQVLALMPGLLPGSDPVPTWENPAIVVFDFTLDADSQVTSGPTWAEVYNVADSQIVFARATNSGGSILLMPLVDGENYIFSAIDNLGTIHSIIPGQSYHSWEYTENGLGEDIAALWNEKLDNNLGSSEAGKFLVVGSDGSITTVAVPSASGVSF